jgi:hypothetical protein
VGLRPKDAIYILASAHAGTQKRHVLLIRGRNLVETAEAQGRRFAGTSRNLSSPQVRGPKTRAEAHQW